MLLRTCILSTALLVACGDAGGPSSTSTGTTGELTMGPDTTGEESTGGESTGPTPTPAEVCAMGVGQPCDIATLEGCTEPLQCRPIVAGSFDGVLCAVICTHSVDDLDCPGIETVCGENGYCVTDDEPACPDFEGSG